MICRATSVSGRLNAFQRMMLHWSELHPYNAIHTYRLSGPLNHSALQQAVADAFEFNNLGPASLDFRTGTFRYDSEVFNCVPEIMQVRGEGNAEDCLSSHIAQELNHPFERPCSMPFRFSAVDAGPTSHFVSLIYDHWTADSIGARLMMRHVLGRYLKLDIPENSEPLDLYPGTYREVFRKRLHGPRLAMPILNSLRDWWRSRPVRTVAYTSPRQTDVGYAMYHLRRNAVQDVRQFARDHGVSVHDVFLAVLSRAMGPALPKRSSKGNSHDMALGTIVDMRGDADEDLSNTLGTFLSYYNVRFADDGHGDLGELVERVGALTHETKRRKSYLDAVVKLRFASAVWKRLKPEDRPYFARRATPLTAGITNVFLRDTWINRYGGGRILDYRRAVSNGPTLPLVISPTTFGDQMNVGVSYRLAGFTQAKVDGIMQRFVEQLESLETSGVKVKAAKTRAAAYTS